MEQSKKLGFKNTANKSAFWIAALALLIFAIFYFFVTDTDYFSWVYYLLPLLLISFGLAVIGLPLERKNDKKVIFRSAFSIIVSISLIVLLGFVYIAPILFPFGFPPDLF